MSSERSESLSSTGTGVNPGAAGTVAATGSANPKRSKNNESGVGYGEAVVSKLGASAGSRANGSSVVGVVDHGTNLLLPGVGTMNLREDGIAVLKVH